MFLALDSAVQRAILQRDYPRQQLASILRSYQQGIGNWDEEVERQIARLAAPESVCVVTGQQVGFATGPIYTVLKAISCVYAARALDLVPVFWAHTEDHDVAEVASATVLSESGDLHRYRATLPIGHFVEDLPWSSQHGEELARFMDGVGIPRQLWEERIHGATRYAEVMVRLLALLMRGTGLLFLEPYLLRPLAFEFFHTQIRESAKLRATLQATSPSLASGVGATSLFYKGQTGKRIRIEQCQKGFLIGDRTRTEEELIEKIRRTPDRFSTGAAARPVLQSAVIPTALYVAGPNEAAYLAQLDAYHQIHGVPVPRIEKRLSISFVPSNADKWLRQIDLNPNEIAVEGEELQAQRSRALAAGFPPKRLHYLRNLLHPRGEPQERVLNFWQFQAMDPGLVPRILSEAKGIHEHCWMVLDQR